MIYIFRIRPSMSGYETLIDGRVFGHIDENGWFPAVGIQKLPFFSLTADNLRSIANQVEEHAAACRSIVK